MLLIITSSGDEHVNNAEKILEKRGVPYFRFDTNRFPEEVSLSMNIGERGFCGLIQDHESKIRLQDVTHCWYRKPSLPDLREIFEDEGHIAFAEQESRSLLKWLYESFSKEVKWLNHPIRLNAARSKVLQLAVACDLGLKVPRTITTNDPQEVTNLLENGPAALKTFGPNGYVTKTQKGSQLRGLYTKRISKDAAGDIEAVRFCPVYMQEYIEKQYELRVTVVGQEVFACAIYSQEIEATRCDWRHPSHVLDLKHEACILPAQLTSQLIRFLERFGLNFGAFDLVVTPGGDYVFLECNPNGQWHWIEELTNMSITGAIIDFFSKGGKVQK